jgi:rhodanese-related sulfurtransferase
MRALLARLPGSARTASARLGAGAVSVCSMQWASALANSMGPRLRMFCGGVRGLRKSREVVVCAGGGRSKIGLDFRKLKDGDRVIGMGVSMPGRA